MTLSRFELHDEAQTQALAKQLAELLPQRFVILMQGDLGAGKTTFTRGILHGLGHQGTVKSPTYTLVEPYDLGHQELFHFDLYRMADPEELEFIGARDYFAANAISVIEWPERAEGFLPPADLQIWLAYAGSGREAKLEPLSAVGRHVVEQLKRLT